MTAYVLIKKQYWKWEGSETTELTYACYVSNIGFGDAYYYLKAPLGSDTSVYWYNSGKLATSSTDLTSMGSNYVATSITENSCIIGAIPHTRYTAGDLYETVSTKVAIPATKDDYDFTTGKAYVLKRKRPKEYRKTVIDTATAGTYTFDVAKDTTARIILVGGGGAGGQVWEGHAEGSGGGSGACVYCKVKLNAGTYTITNGAAGVFPRGNAGNSTLSLGDTTLITAGGGTGGQDSGGAVGVGGTYSFADSVEIEKIVFASNGNNGIVGGNMWGGIGGASVYKGYGAGGYSRTGGNAGYIWVELTTDETDYDYKIDNDACYVLKRKQYWKYEYQDWTQPVLTANGTMGGSSFAVAASSNYSGWDAYKAFDGSTAIGTGWSASSNSTPQHIIFYNPSKIKVTKINILNSGGGGGFASGSIYGSDDGSSWVEIAPYTNTDFGVETNWNIDLPNDDKAYKYHKLEITSVSGFTSTNYIKTTEIAITATEQITVKATKDDYDFITD